MPEAQPPRTTPPVEDQQTPPRATLNKTSVITGAQGVWFVCMSLCLFHIFLEEKSGVFGSHCLLRLSQERAQDRAQERSQERARERAQERVMRELKIELKKELNSDLKRELKKELKNQLKKELKKELKRSGGN